MGKFFPGEFFWRISFDIGVIFLGKFFTRDIFFWEIYSGKFFPGEIMILGKFFPGTF